MAQTRAELIGEAKYGLALAGVRDLRPQETAVAIAAEFIDVRHGGTALPLAWLDGPVHRDRTASAYAVRS